MTLKTGSTRILVVLDTYAYNAYELCRILNGQDPRNFSSCFFTTKEKAFGSHASDRCKWRKRSCQVYSRAVDKILRRLERQGQIHSVVLRWFDGRSKGSGQDPLHTDRFRFYYVRREGLARRLVEDIVKHLLGGEIA